MTLWLRSLSNIIFEFLIAFLVSKRHFLSKLLAKGLLHLIYDSSEIEMAKKMKGEESADFAVSIPHL